MLFIYGGNSMESTIQARTNHLAAPPQSLAESVTGSRSLKKQRRFMDEFIRVVLFFCGILSIFTTFGIVYVLAEQALLFFDSKAFVIAKAPVINEEQTVILGAHVDAGSKTLQLAFDGDRIPFANRQYLTIGGEVVRVIERGRTTLEVERGMDGTIAIEHAADDTIFGMRAVQIKPIADVAAESTVIELEPSFGRRFTVGDMIQLDQEIMQVTAISPDSITVERGIEDTQARDHEANDGAIALAEKASLGEFLTTTRWQPQIGDFGIWALLNATLITSAIALLVAIPLGLSAAIYLSEYAPSRVRSVLKPILEVLAGIPTVVYGFFALTFMSPLLRSVLGAEVQFQNTLSAGIVIGILLIPYISSFSEDALRAVPRALREASYGLGATKLETTVKVVLPAAVSGIAAAFILAASRAVGETMIVAIAAGSGPNFTFNIFEGAETMTGHIARISGGDLSYNSIDYNSIFAIGLMLFMMTLILNLISTFVTDRFRERY